MTSTSVSKTQALLNIAKRQTSTIEIPAGYNCSSTSVYPLRTGAQTKPAYHCVPVDGAPCAAYVHTIEFPNYPDMFPLPLPSTSDAGALEKVIYPTTAISTLTCMHTVPSETHVVETSVPFAIGDSPLPLSMQSMVTEPSSPSVATTTAARAAVCEEVVASIPVSLSDLSAFPTSEDVQALYERVNQYSMLSPQPSTSPSNVSSGYPKWISVDGVPQTSGIALVLKSTGKRVAQFHQGANAAFPCGFPRYTTPVTSDRKEHCTQCVDANNVCADYTYSAGPVVNGTPTADPTATNPVCPPGTFSAIATIPCSEMQDTTGTPFSEIVDPTVLSVWDCTPYFTDGSFHYACNAQLSSENSSLEASDFEVQAYQKVSCDNPAFASCVTGLVDTLQKNLSDANRTTQRRTLEELRYDIPPTMSSDTLLDRLQNSYTNWTMEPGCYTHNGEMLVKANNDACAPRCSAAGKYTCGGKSYPTLLDAIQDPTCASSGETPCIPYACPGATITECDKNSKMYWVTSPELEGRLAQLNTFRSPSDWTLGEQRISAHGNVQFSALAHAPLNTTGTGNVASVSHLLTHGIVANTCHASQIEANQVDRYSVVISDPESVAAVTNRIFALTNTGCVHAQSGNLVGSPWNIGTAKMVADQHQLENSAFGLQMGYDPSVGCSAAPSAQNPNIDGVAWADVLGQLCADSVITCETGCAYPLYAFEEGHILSSDELTTACGCAASDDTCALCIGGKKSATASGEFACAAAKDDAQSHDLPLPSITQPTHIWQTSSAFHKGTRLPVGVSQSDVNGTLPRVDWSCATASGNTACAFDKGLTDTCTLGTYQQTGSARGGCYIDDIRFDMIAVPPCEQLPSAGECASCRSGSTPSVSNEHYSPTDAEMESLCASGGICLYGNMIMPYMYQYYEPGGFNLGAFETSLAKAVNTFPSMDNPGMDAVSYDAYKICSLLPAEGIGDKSEAMCKKVGGTWYDGSVHEIAYKPNGSYEVNAGCDNHIMDWKCTIVDKQQVECTTGSLSQSAVSIDLESDTSNTSQTTATLVPAASDASDTTAFHAYTHTSKYQNGQYQDLYGLDRFHTRVAQYAGGALGTCVDMSPLGTQYISACDPSRGAQLSNALGYMYG